MTFSQSLLTLWPGLARLWLRGELTSLAKGVAFGWLVQFALVVTFIWPELAGSQFSPTLVSVVAWVLVLWFWVIGLRSSRAFVAAELRTKLAPDEVSTALLRQAQTEYLKGHWLEAETLLGQLLTKKPADTEAKLLLAGVFRRTKRIDKAEKQLRQLAESPTAARWHYELARELELLTEIRTKKLETETAAKKTEIKEASPTTRPATRRQAA